VTNTPAYNSLLLITAVKSFFSQALKGFNVFAPDRSKNEKNVERMEMLVRQVFLC
jgi:hypothetical protein